MANKYLTDKTIASVIDKTHTPLIFCDINDSLSEAMEKLVQHKILAMPVYDTFRDYEFKGLIGLLEIVEFISKLHWELISESIPYREADMYVRFNNASVSDILTPGHVKLHDNSNYAVVAQTFISTDYKRIPIVDDAGKVVYLVTLSKMVNILYEGLNSFSPSVMKTPVSQLPVVQKVLQVPTDSKVDLYELTGILGVNVIAKAIEAFRLLVGTSVSAVPIVDNVNKLVGSIAVRDIRAIASNASDVRVLYDENCETFMKRSSAPYESLYVYPNDTFGSVIEKLQSNKIHRVWVVNQQLLVLTAIGLKDVLSVLI